MNLNKVQYPLLVFLSRDPAPGVRIRVASFNPLPLPVLAELRNDAVPYVASGRRTPVRHREGHAVLASPPGPTNPRSTLSIGDLRVVAVMVGLILFAIIGAHHDSDTSADPTLAEQARVGADVHGRRQDASGPLVRDDGARLLVTKSAAAPNGGRVSFG